MNDAIPEARLIRLPLFADARGSLTVAEYAGQLPFVPQRVFFVYGVPSESTRGEHAHKACHQAIVCASGSMKVEVENRDGRRQFVLDNPETLLYLPPMVWAAQHGYSEGTISIVLASHPYEADDYIRDLNEWRAMAAS